MIDGECWRECLMLKKAPFFSSNNKFLISLWNSPLYQLLSAVAHVWCCKLFCGPPLKKKKLGMLNFFFFLKISANKSLQGLSYVTNKETLHSEKLKGRGGGGISCNSNITSYWGSVGSGWLGMWERGGGSSGISFQTLDQREKKEHVVSY